MKKNINENEELRRIHLLMNYDSKKTLNENEQSIEEQVPYADEFGEPTPTAQPAAEPAPETERETQQGNESNIVTDADLLGNTNKFRSFFQQLSDYGLANPMGGPIIGGIAQALGLPNLFDAIGLNPANILGGRRTGVKGVVDALDGWVSVEDLTYVLTTIKSLEGKCYIDDIQEPPVKVPAIQRFLELYSEDENGENLVDEVNSVGTRTLPAGTDKIKQKIVYLINKLSQDTCEEDKKDIVDPNTPKKQTYRPCAQFPFSVGCINEAIKDLQKCLGGLKIDGYFGPKTLEAIVAKLPDFDGSLTKELFDKLMAPCRTSERGENIPISKMDPRKGDISINQPLTPKTIKVKTTPGMTPEQIYQQLAPELGKGRRLRYKGTLDNDTYTKLTQYLAKNGYKKTKVDPTKDTYGTKYVWVK